MTTPHEQLSGLITAHCQLQERHDRLEAAARLYMEAHDKLAERDDFEWLDAVEQLILQRRQRLRNVLKAAGAFDDNVQTREGESDV